MFGPSLVVVGLYFNRRRSLANGLAAAGGSLGQLVLPVVITQLVNHYQFSGQFKILLTNINAYSKFYNFIHLMRRGGGERVRGVGTWVRCKTGKYQVCIQVGSKSPKSIVIPI